MSLGLDLLLVKAMAYALTGLILNFQSEKPWCSSRRPQMYFDAFL